MTYLHLCHCTISPMHVQVLMNIHVVHPSINPNYQFNNVKHVILLILDLNMWKLDSINLNMWLKLFKTNKIARTLNLHFWTWVWVRINRVCVRIPTVCVGILRVCKRIHKAYAHIHAQKHNFKASNETTIKQNLTCF